MLACDLDMPAGSVGSPLKTIFEKLGAKNPAELARLAERLGLPLPPAAFVGTPARLRPAVRATSPLAPRYLRWRERRTPRDPPRFCSPRSGGARLVFYWTSRPLISRFISLGSRSRSTHQSRPLPACSPRQAT